jgi:adenosine deaminase CECR1
MQTLIDKLQQVTIPLASALSGEKSFRKPETLSLTSIEQYDAELARLKQAEYAMSFDAESRSEASPALLEAANLVKGLLKHDKVQLKMLESEHLYLAIKARLNASPVHTLLKRMPKGALLHAHFDASIDCGILLEQARNNPHLHAKFDRPLRAKEGCWNAPLAAFQPFPSQQGSTPGTEWCPWSKVCETWSEIAGGSGFDSAEDWLRSTIELQRHQVEPADLSINDVWASFLKSFGIVEGLLFYESALKAYCVALFEHHLEEGLCYVELRVNFAVHGLYSDNGSETFDHTKIVQVIDAAHAEFEASLKTRNDTRHWAGYKIIYCGLRFFEPELIKQHLDACLDMKKRFPNIICGFDLVGQEDVGRPLQDYKHELLAFRQQCAAENIDLPLILHAGETLSSGHGADDNLFDAILLGAKRIGHGVSLTKHPLLMQLAREHGVCVEVCPISNELLHLCKTIQSHPLPELLAYGVPCSINTDDAMILQNTVTADLAQVLLASTRLDLVSLRELGCLSIVHSCLDDADKARALARYKQDFELFCKTIVEEKAF